MTLMYMTTSTPPYTNVKSLFIEKNSSLMNALCFLIIHMRESPFYIWYNNHNININIIKYITYIFITMLVFCISGCSKNQESEEQYNRLQSRYYALSKEYNDVVEKGKSRVVELESKISVLRGELSDVSAEKKKIESEIGGYREIIDFMNKGDIDKAILLSKNITLSSVTELDIKIVEFVALSERLARLEEIKEKTNQLSDRNRIAVDILPRIGQLFIITFIILSIVAASMAIYKLIMSITDKIEMISAIALSAAAIGSYIGSFAVTKRPLSSVLFDAVMNTDSPAIKVLMNSQFFSVIFDVISPVVIGVIAGNIIKKVASGNTYSEKAKTLTLIMSLIIVFVMHTAIQYGINPKSGGVYNDNMIFVISAVLTFAFTRVPQGNEEKSEKNVETQS